MLFKVAVHFTGDNLYVDGPGYLSLYSDSLRTGRSGERIPVQAKLSASVQTGNGAKPASCKWVPRLCPGGKAAGAWY
jgi:hypothetical protein